MTLVLGSVMEVNDLTLTFLPLHSCIPLFSTFEKKKIHSLPEMLPLSYVFTPPVPSLDVSHLHFSFFSLIYFLSAQPRLLFFCLSL